MASEVEATNETIERSISVARMTAKDATSERVQDANAELHQSLDRLTESLNELFDRLGPVLRESDPTPGSLRSVVGNSISDVQAVLRTSIDVVSTLIDRTDAIRFRLDI